MHVIAASLRGGETVAELQVVKVNSTINPKTIRTGRTKNSSAIKNPMSNLCNVTQQKTVSESKINSPTENYPFTKKCHRC